MWKVVLKIFIFYTILIMGAFFLAKACDKDTPRSAGASDSACEGECDCYEREAEERRQRRLDRYQYDPGILRGDY